jgi:hypothetical protein
MKEEMFGECRKFGKDEKCKNILIGNLKGRDNFGELDVCER